APTGRFSHCQGVGVSSGARRRKRERVRILPWPPDVAGFDFLRPVKTRAMGFLVSLIVTAFGFVLALAVHPTHPGSVNVNTVGWILVVFGLIGFFADLLLWSS